MDKSTLAYFSRYPDESWQWNLTRRAEVLTAEPNPAHHALARAEDVMGDRFVLITQNIDRLHIRAGNSEERTIEVHGHYQGMRCAAGCPACCPSRWPSTDGTRRPTGRASAISWSARSAAAPPGPTSCGSTSSTTRSTTG